MSDTLVTTRRLLSALLLVSALGLSACGIQKGSPAPATDPDREVGQGELLAAPPPVTERRLDDPTGAQPAPRYNAPAQPAPAPVAPAPQSAPPTAPVTGEPGPGYIVLQPGETLGYISALYGVSERDLVAWNGLSSPNDVRAGQRLAVRRPAGSGSAPAHQAAQPAQSPQSTQSTQSGQSGQPVRNHPGPATESDGTVVVAPGQSLSGIAKSHGVTTAQLREWNKLKSDTIKAGQTLRVQPSAGADGALGAPGAAPAAEGRMVLRPEQGADAPDSEGMITVRSGQSLLGIAAKYKVSAANLRKWNNLKSDQLKIGRQLRVQRLHTVKPGESLGGIAAKYKVSSKAIMQANKLTNPDIVPEGRQLIIP